MSVLLFEQFQDYKNEEELPDVVYGMDNLVYVNKKLLGTWDIHQPKFEVFYEGHSYTGVCTSGRVEDLKRSVENTIVSQYFYDKVRFEDETVLDLSNAKVIWKYDRYDREGDGWSVISE